jgi:hypothetical protein
LVFGFIWPHNAEKGRILIVNCIDSSNGASSVVPGFNAMLASGALLLAGAVL